MELAPSSEKKTVSYMLPCTKRKVHGLEIQLPMVFSPLELKNISLTGKNTRQILTDELEFIGDSGSVKKIDSHGLIVAPGSDTRLCFPFKKYMPVNKKVDFVYAFYAFVISLSFGILVMVRFGGNSAKKHLFSVFHIAVMLSLLIFPLLSVDYFGKVSNENRFLAEFPSMFYHGRFNVKYPRQIEDWFSDRFAYRDDIIHLEKQLFQPMVDSEDKFFQGKEGWLYTGAFNSVPIFRNENRFSEPELELCVKNVQRFAAWSKEQFGAELYVMITPDKERVYSEFYPDKYKKFAHPESRLEQLYHALKKSAGVKVVCPLELFKEKKKEHLLYYKPGTHWNYRGAFFAMEELLDLIRKDFPEIGTAQSLIEEKWIKKREADIDIAKIGGYTDPYKQLSDDVLVNDFPVWKFPVTRTDVSKFSAMYASIFKYTSKNQKADAPKIYVISDSFMGFALPFIVPFSSVSYWTFFGNGEMFEKAVFKRHLSEVKPDIIIVESTERFLSRFLNLNIK